MATPGTRLNLRYPRPDCPIPKRRRMPRDPKPKLRSLAWAPSWAAKLTVISLLSSAACSESPPSSKGQWQGWIEALGDTTAAVVGIGAFAEGPQGPAFGSLQSGTIAPGGGWFAVSDRDPPHIRVFRSNGTLLTSFLNRGEGPSESRAHRHFILADSDTTLLLLESDQLRRFTLAGRELDRFPLGAMGYRPQAMGRGCGDAMFLLAPRLGPLDEEGSVQWLHRIETGDSGALGLTPVWVDSLMYRRGLFLAAHRLLPVGDLLLISRNTSEGKKEETLYCRGDGAVLSADEVPPSANTPVPLATVIGRIFNESTFPLQPGKEYPLTVAAHSLGGQGILRVQQITYVVGPDPPPASDILLSVQVGADTVASVRFPRYFEILDVLGSQALVTYTDFIPRVFLYNLPLPS